METTDTIIVKKDAALLVRLEPSLHAQLMAKSKKDGMSAAAMVRVAIRTLVGYSPTTPRTRRKAK